MGSARKGERDDTTLRVKVRTRDRFNDWLEKHFLRSQDAGLKILLDFAEKNHLSFVVARNDSILSEPGKEEKVDGVHSG